MKLAVIVALCTFAGLAAAQCVQFTGCVPAGTTCDTFNCLNSFNPNNTCSICELTGQCLTSVNGTRQCVDNDLLLQRTCPGGLDSECRDSSSPAYSYGPKVECRNSVCVSTRGVPGDDCASNDDCLTNLCTNGKCVETVTLGADCSNDYDCPIGSTCRQPSSGGNDVCMETLKEGKYCGQFAESICGPGLTCGELDVCIKPYSLGRGKACGSNSECGDDLTCINNACQDDRFFFNKTETCSRTGNNECSNVGSCECDWSSSTAGEEFCMSDISKCTENAYSFFSCIRGAGCHEDSDAARENSCAWHKCRGAYKAVSMCGLYNAAKLAPKSCLAGLSPAAALDAFLF